MNYWVKLILQGLLFGIGFSLFTMGLELRYGLVPKSTIASSVFIAFGLMFVIYSSTRNNGNK